MSTSYLDLVLNYLQIFGYVFNPSLLVSISVKPYGNSHGRRLSRMVLKYLGHFHLQSIHFIVDEMGVDEIKWHVTVYDNNNVALSDAEKLKCL